MITISNDHIYHQFMQSCSNAQSSIQLVSPYLKENIFREIGQVKSKKTSIELVTSMTVHNAIAGATDLQAIKYCLKMNGITYNRTNLHAKMYLFDQKFGIVTSANLTNGGLHHNYEASVLFDEPNLIRQLDQVITTLKADELTGLVTIENLEQTDLLANKIKAKYNAAKAKQKTLGTDLLRQLTGWNALVFQIINEKITKDEFTLQEVYNYKSSLKQIYPDNHNVEAKIRQTLQNLRDIGLIEFVSKGKYKKGY
ncbi:phospholipase D-like domain-containing protein [Lactobacillus sp. ESL0791]|uniref:phospholipase D-like domain-containing protein n=1 Tax=Lactobacillus sp. ESL0791 TaxID=2983234 RepID=UPI0023F96D76|nr:phospholipase D-like domain-containing protein [Lactobacillus sp. ESL0791]MDF7639277.1 phospholipase D-like domain-containing protein [Lactobacillus sp. ESL0791]